MPDRKQIAADWESRGFSCDLWTDAPGQRWEDFTHATDELVTVLEGDMEFEVESRLHHPQPGKELLIPAGAVHAARNVGSTTARWLYGYRRALDSVSSAIDYRSEVDRRVQQFAHYVKLMHGRAHEEVHGNCFIIFEERSPDRPTEDGGMAEQTQVVLQAASQAWMDWRWPSGLDDGITGDLPDAGWREDPSLNRFIQFSMERDWFCMDLPLCTLFRPEAEEILSCRRGFFYLRDRKQFTLYGEDVEGHDPFRKIYTYGDEESAAEDMAFVFFKVWKFPVDSRFYVTAAAFSGKKRWEQGFPID